MRLMFQTNAPFYKNSYQLNYYEYSVFQWCFFTRHLYDITLAFNNLMPVKLLIYLFQKLLFIKNALQYIDEK